jgi:two-component system, chemotaxis family, chemotaxis protein CheY
MPKVMVVEDSSAMRGLIASVLGEIDDCHVIEAPTGYEALRRLPREAVNLVVTDINMPDINGLELLSFIRKNRNFDAVPVLVVTTEGSERDREKALALGADAYLVKPFEPGELRDLAAKLLAGRGGARR